MTKEVYRINDFFDDLKYKYYFDNRGYTYKEVKGQIRPIKCIDDTYFNLTKKVGKPEKYYRWYMLILFKQLSEKGREVCLMELKEPKDQKKSKRF